MSAAPCRNCSNRHQGCHGSCEEYQKFREARDEFNAMLKKAHEAESDYFAVRIKGKRNAQ